MQTDGDLVAADSSIYSLTDAKRINRESTDLNGASVQTLAFSSGFAKRGHAELSLFSAAYA